MSKNISIKEGGKSYAFGPVKAIMINNGSNVYYPWHPMVQSSDTLQANENKIYRAQGYDLSGWGQVSVNAPKMKPTLFKVIGINREAGIAYGVYTNPLTGELVEEILYAGIKRNYGPSKTLYNSGEDINFRGIGISPFDSRGGEYQDIIPYNKLIFPVKKAYTSEPRAIQNIPVQWRDPHSGALLETSFPITVYGG